MRPSDHLDRRVDHRPPAPAGRSPPAARSDTALRDLEGPEFGENAFSVRWHRSHVDSGPTSVDIRPKVPLFGWLRTVKLAMR